MGMREVESRILAELKQLTGRNKLRIKDIAEWSTSEEVVKKNKTESEVVVHCPGAKVWCAIPVAG